MTGRKKRTGREEEAGWWHDQRIRQRRVILRSNGKAGVNCRLALIDSAKREAVGDPRAGAFAFSNSRVTKQSGVSDMMRSEPTFSIEKDKSGSGDCVVITRPDGTRIVVTGFGAEIEAQERIKNDGNRSRKSPRA